MKKENCCTGSPSVGDDLKKTNVNQTYVIIFTNHVDLNKKLATKEPGIVLSVSKSFESVISDFNVEYEQRKLGMKRRGSSMLPLERKGKTKKREAAADGGDELMIRHMSYESNDFAIKHVWSDEQDEIRNSIAQNPSEIVNMPNQQGPPILLTDFKIDCILGKGAFGQVYKVIH